MPVIRDTSISRRRAPGWFERLFRRDVAPADPEPMVQPPRATVDANTRTFWARGAASPTTLVEGRTSPPHPSQRRVAALIEAHEQGRTAHAERPRANPAFTEALFVELMRAHQYQRAFAMLSHGSRRAWGSAEAFAAAQGSGPMRRLRGVRVLDVRHLSEWTDVDHRATYRDVAELDVEYTIGSDRETVRVPRVVHLVSAEGRWWSLCYPG